MGKISKIIKRIKKKKEILPIVSNIEEKDLLKDKVALVTGGSGGIGKAIAAKLANCGCKVIISGTNEEKLQKICEKIGKNCKYMILNLSDCNSFETKKDEAVSIFGKIDILINSAGVHINRKNQDFINFTEDEYDSVMDINLKGTYFFNQKMASYFISNKIKAHILFISSSTSFEPAWSPYRLSKWALNGLIKGMAQDLIEFGIVVNGISPGSTATNLLNYKEGESIYTEENTNKRYAMPEEIANFAVMLVGPTGDMLVGENICMSGGRGIIELR